MYGTPTCGDCVLAKQVFAEKNIDSEYIDISNDEEATKNAIFGPAFAGKIGKFGAAPVNIGIARW